MKDAEIVNDEVIRRKDNAYSPVGGLSVLFGNIAPNGGVIKVGAVDPSIKTFMGEAIVYESQDEALAGIESGEVKEGHVVVIRYEGPKGGPGCRKCSPRQRRSPDGGLRRKWPSSTDGRFSGASRGSPSVTYH